MATTAPRRAADASTVANRLGWAGLPVLLLILTALLVWPKPTTAQLINLGDGAFSKGDWSNAYASYLLATQADPKSTLAHVKLAATYDKTRHYDQAVTELQQAERLDPTVVTAAQLQTELSQRDAETHLKSDLAKVGAIVNEDQDFRDGWLRIAYDQYRLKLDQDAKKAALAAQELDPNYTYTIKLLQLLP